MLGFAECYGAYFTAQETDHFSAQAAAMRQAQAIGRKDLQEKGMHQLAKEQESARFDRARDVTLEPKLIEDK